jgi:hypothetical protein
MAFLKKLGNVDEFTRGSDILQQAAIVPFHSLTVVLSDEA